MTARVGTLSVDGTPISQADLARIEAEEKLHADQQRRAVHVIAAASSDAADCRMLLSMLGLGREVVVAARSELGAPTAVPAGATAGAAAGAAAKRARKRRVAA